MPDIDMDFDDERRGEVIDYVREKYGDDKVAQIITFGTMKARAAVRDAGRVLGYPYGVPDKISKMIVEELGATIESSLAQNSEFMADYEANPDTKRIVDAASALEGIVRGEGVHAAGVVICRDPLHYYVPGQVRHQGWLGHHAIRRPDRRRDGPAQDGLPRPADPDRHRRRGQERARRHTASNSCPTNSRSTTPRRSRCYSAPTRSACSRSSRRGMRQLLRDLVPDRPSPTSSPCSRSTVRARSAVAWCATSSSASTARRKVTYYDDRLKPILEETYGAIVYQEQVMRISMDHGRVLGGQGGQAPQGHGQEAARRACRRSRRRGSRGAGAATVTTPDGREHVGGHPKFAEYAFNKSHSAAYGLLIRRRRT